MSTLNTHKIIKSIESLALDLCKPIGPYRLTANLFPDEGKKKIAGL